MNLFEKEKPGRAAIFSAFLNAKGKILFDNMIVKPKLAGQDDPREIEYWIDIDGNKDADDLMKLLKKYKMRKKVEINDLSHIIKSF